MILIGDSRTDIKRVEKKMRHRFYKMLFDRVRRKLGMKNS